MRMRNWYGDGKGDKEMDRLIDAHAEIRFKHVELGIVEGYPAEQTGEDLYVYVTKQDGIKTDGSKGIFLRGNIRNVEVIS